MTTFPAANFPEFVYLHLYGRIGEEGRVWGGRKMASGLGQTGRCCQKIKLQKTTGTAAAASVMG